MARKITTKKSKRQSAGKLSRLSEERKPMKSLTSSFHNISKRTLVSIVSGCQLRLLANSPKLAKVGGIPYFLNKNPQNLMAFNRLLLSFSGIRQKFGGKQVNLTVITKRVKPGPRNAKSGGSPKLEG